MPKTARKHFGEDIARATAILSHAQPLPHRQKATKQLRDDLLRSAWMFSVGAMDAYFCDAYADMLARVLRAKSLQPSVQLTNAVASIDLPVEAIFAPTNIRVNWKWRLAARGLIEKDNVLSLSKVQSLFNPFLRSGKKLFAADVIDDWINNGAPQRLVGVSKTAFRAMAPAGKESARKKARAKLSQRYSELCQRRHDCIHNCDRPRMKPQRISYATAAKAVDDVRFLIDRCDSHFEAEFNCYLTTIGASAKTKAATRY